jgi:hypothetical protein
MLTITSWGLRSQLRDDKAKPWSSSACPPVKDSLLAAQPGDALLLAGGQRAAFQALAFPVEHQLITTDWPGQFAAADGLCRPGTF